MSTESLALLASGFAAAISLASLWFTFKRTRTAVSSADVNAETSSESLINSNLLFVSKSLVDWPKLRPHVYPSESRPEKLEDLEDRLRLASVLEVLCDVFDMALRHEERDFSGGGWSLLNWADSVIEQSQAVRDYVLAHPEDWFHEGVVRRVNEAERKAAEVRWEST